MVEIIVIELKTQHFQILSEKIDFNVSGKAVSHLFTRTVAADQSDARVPVLMA